MIDGNGSKKRLQLIIVNHPNHDHLISMKMNTNNYPDGAVG